MRSVITRRDKVHAYRPKIQSRFSRKQSLKRKICILYFRLLFSRRIIPFPLVPPVTIYICKSYLSVYSNIMNIKYIFFTCTFIYKEILLHSDPRIIRHFEQEIRTRRKFLTKQKFLDFKEESRFYRVVYLYY